MKKKYIVLSIVLISTLFIIFMYWNNTENFDFDEVIAIGIREPNSTSSVLYRAYGEDTTEDREELIDYISDLRFTKIKECEKTNSLNNDDYRVSLFWMDNSTLIFSGGCAFYNNNYESTTYFKTKYSTEDVKDIIINITKKQGQVWG